MDSTSGFVIIALIAYAAFHQWLRQNRRNLIHQERLVALEKGVALPPIEQEIQRSTWNVQRMLLLAGLSWIAVGTTVIIVLDALIQHAPPLPPVDGDARLHLIPWASFIPEGLQWVGLAPIGIGLAHLIAFFAGRRKDM